MSHHHFAGLDLLLSIEFSIGSLDQIRQKDIDSSIPVYRYKSQSSNWPRTATTTKYSNHNKVFCSPCNFCLASTTELDDSSHYAASLTRSGEITLFNCSMVPVLTAVGLTKSGEMTLFNCSMEPVLTTVSLTRSGEITLFNCSMEPVLTAVSLTRSGEITLFNCSVVPVLTAVSLTRSGEITLFNCSMVPVLTAVSLTRSGEVTLFNCSMVQVLTAVSLSNNRLSFKYRVSKKSIHV